MVAEEVQTKLKAKGGNGVGENEGEGIGAGDMMTNSTSIDRSFEEDEIDVGMLVRSLSIFVDDAIAPLLSRKAMGVMFWTDKKWLRKSSAWDAVANLAEAVGTGTVLMSVVMRLAEVREWGLWWRAVSRLLYAVHFDGGRGARK